MNETPIEPMSLLNFLETKLDFTASAYRLLVSLTTKTETDTTIEIGVDMGAFLDAVAIALVGSIHAHHEAMRRLYSERDDGEVIEANDPAEQAKAAGILAERFAHHLASAHVKSCDDCKAQIIERAEIKKMAAEVLAGMHVDADADEDITELAAAATSPTHH